MRSWSLTVTCGLALVLTADALFAAEVTVADILKNVASAPEPVRNVYSRVYSVLRKGNDISWNEMVTYADESGRRRVEIQHGVFDEKGERVPTTLEWCIDEVDLTAEYDFNYSFKLGPKKRDGTETQIGIFDRRSGAGTFPQNTVLSRLRANGLRDADPESTEVRQIEDGIYEVLHSLPKATSQFRTLIDATKGWAAVKQSLVAQDGTAISSYELDVKQSSEGFWLPVAWKTDRIATDMKPFQLPNGRVLTGARRLPKVQQSGKVVELRINDPKFSDDVFKIVLHARSRVWDSRYKVDYRAGTEDVEGDEAIDAAAKSAVARQLQKAVP